MGSNNSSSTQIHHDFRSPIRNEIEASPERSFDQDLQTKYFHHGPRVQSVDQDLQTKYLHHDPQVRSVDQDLQATYLHRGPQVRFVDQDPQTKYLHHDPQVRSVDQDLHTTYLHHDPQVRSVDQDLHTTYLHQGPQVRSVDQDLQTKFGHQGPQVRSFDQDLQTKYLHHGPQVKSVDQDLQTTYLRHGPQVRSVDQDLQTKYLHHDPQVRSVDQDLHTTYLHQGSQVRSVDQDLQTTYLHQGPQVRSVDQDPRSKFVHHGPQVKSVDQNLQVKPVDQNLQTKSVHQNSRIKSVHQNSRIKSVHQDRQVKSVDEETEAKPGKLDLNQMTLPSELSHVKSGNTLCSIDSVMLIQDGSTTIEFRLLPNLEPKRIPWRFGLVRDIIWCSDLGVFILLTKDALFNISPKSLLIPATAVNKPMPDFTINTYKKAKPYDSKALFWRCTCVGTTLYISYSGHGAVIDEYSLTILSCKFVNRWTPPKTCAAYEGIWCIRNHPDTNQLCFTILDTRNDQWRMEVRNRDKLTLVWQLALPSMSGDWEISPLSDREWLAINSCGTRLVQIADQKLKAAIDYGRELRNAIVINNLHFLVRTKTTIELHQLKRLK